MNGADSALHIKEHGEGYGFLISTGIGNMLTSLPNGLLRILEKIG